jgi:MFS family permease
VGISFFFTTSVLLGYLIHIVPMLGDRGISPAIATFAASLFGFFQLIGRLLAGYLLDKVSAPYLVAGLWAVASISLALLWLGIVGAGLLFCAALLGLAWGGEGDVLAYLVTDNYGLKSFGRIYSVLLMINLLGGVLGPIALGWTFDATGSYTLVLGIMGLTMLSASVAMAITGYWTNQNA